MSSLLTFSYSAILIIPASVPWIAKLSLNIVLAGSSLILTLSRAERKQANKTEMITKLKVNVQSSYLAVEGGRVAPLTIILWQQICPFPSLPCPFHSLPFPCPALPLPCPFLALPPISLLLMLLTLFCRYHPCDSVAMVEDQWGCHCCFGFCYCCCCAGKSCGTAAVPWCFCNRLLPLPTLPWLRCFCYCLWSGNVAASTFVTYHGVAVAVLSFLLPIVVLLLLLLPLWG